jgi:hypothetical protein
VANAGESLKETLGYILEDKIIQMKFNKYEQMHAAAVDASFELELPPVASEFSNLSEPQLSN